MDSKLKSIIVYIVLNIDGNTISIARLIRIIFLSEWYSAIVRNETMTSEVWYRRNFGPYTNSVLESLIELGIKIEKGLSIDGMSFIVSNTDFLMKNYTLSEIEMKILELAIKHTKNLDFGSLNEHIENLYPVKNTEINAQIKILELVKKAS